VKQALEQSGKPLHITDILKRIGKENTKKNRLSLGGTLSRYVREGNVFMRAGPNTFGLMSNSTESDEEELPPEFGT
jgi:hypothetical protein